MVVGLTYLPSAIYCLPYLALPLLVLRFHLIYDIDAAFSAHNLIIRTNFLYAGTHFHADHPLLFVDDTLLLAIKTNSRGKLSDPS